MAKLLTGTRIYGTGTVDTQLFVSGTNSATSTTTGALQVVGGVGIGGNLYVGGTIFGGIITGTASTATNADNVKTVSQTTNASYYPAFVDSNNSTAAYEALYTTSSFIVNPQSGNIGIGATPATKLHVYGGGGTTLRLQTASTSSGNFIDFYTPNGIRQGYIGTVDNTGQFFIHNELPTALIFDTNNTERLRITGTGSVGIGTNSPSYPLHLLTTSTTSAAFRNSASTTTQILVGNTAGDTTIRTVGSGDSFIFSDTSKYLAFGTGATERLRITANGGISFGASGTAYGVSGQILQSNGDAAPTWISTGSLAAANATTATHLSGGVAGQIPYQTAPGVTAFLSTGTAGDVLVSNGSSAATYNNTLRLAGATNATSTSSGALQVVGGVGVGGDLFIQGDIRTNDTLFNLINGNATTVNFAGDATALTMGASGSGTTNVRNNLTVNGNLTVQGTTTIVDSTVTNIADPIITLGGGTGNTAPTADDNKDRGVAFKYVNNAGTTSTGFFGYDDSTGYLTYVPSATITNEVVSGTKGAMDVNLAGGTAMSIHYQSAADNTAFLAASTSGYLLQTNGTGSAPTWVSASGVSAGSATNADNIRTIAQTGNAAHFLTFVDSNNATNAYESVYTTSSFSINPATGAVSIGNAIGAARLSLGALVSNRVLSIYDDGTNWYGLGIAGSEFRNLAPQNWTVGTYTRSSDTYTERVRVDSGGNVNIGTFTTSIAKKFTVVGEGNFTDVSSNSRLYIGWGTIPGTGGTGGYLFNNDNSSLVFGTTNTERMRISTTGDVGIGTTSPTHRLTVTTSTNSATTTASTIALHLFNLASDGNISQPGRVGIGFGASTTRSAIVAGTYGNDYLDFYTGGDITTPRIRIRATGAIAFSGTNTHGSSGFVLKSNGDAAPTWVDPSTLASASATNADNIRTISQAANASYYPTFVDSNNAANAYELVYTTSSFSINPATGAVSILGLTTSTANKLQIGQTSVPATTFTSTTHLRIIGTANTATDEVFITLVRDRNPSIQYAGGAAISLGSYITPTAGSAPSSRLTFSLKSTLDNSDVVNVQVMSLLDNGNVGIGTTSPTDSASFGRAVDIQSNGGGAVYFRASGTDPTNSYFTVGYSPTAAYLYNRANSPMYFYTNATERLRITAAGGLAFNGAANYGTSGQILQSNGDAAPTWINQSSITSGGTSLTNTYVGYGSASNLLTGSSSLTWNGSRLHVAGPGNSTGGNITIGAQTNNTVKWSYIVSTHYAATAEPEGFALIGGYTDATSNKVVIGGQIYETNPATEIQFWTHTATTHSTGGSQRMVIDTNGNVGIGVTGPSHKLDVAGATTYSYAQGSYSSGATLALKAASTTANDYTGIRFVNSNGSREAFFGVVQGSTSAIGDFVFQTYSAATTSYGERMRVMHNGNVIIGGNGSTATNKFEVAGNAGQLFSVSDSFTGTIFSANDVSGIPSIEVLDTGLVKLAQYNGAVTIGTGTVSSSTAELSVYGMLYTSGAQGEIRASSEITAYFSSDRRLKENIKLIENPITIIDQIRGVTFDWTDEHMARRGGEDGYFVRKHDIGVIAQEVQAVLPELVGTREDGYLAVKYEKLVPLLIEAIKAQQKTIDSLVKDLDSVKEFINNFKNGI